eukprot:7721944-Karenia_brevis.AAC.1
MERCAWCINASGWHRCNTYCHEHNLPLSDRKAFRWKKSSLYDLNGNDIDRVVVRMLQQALPGQRIQRMLEALNEHELMSDAKLKSLS